MATKLKLITELSERTARDVVKNPINWTSFIKTAAQNYKYPFQDQLLIYAQRPDATACAPIEVWNERFSRWVNRGAKGIALINDSGSNLSLRHVFDITDTNSRYNRPVILWSLKEEYQEEVIEALENTFGDFNDSSNMISVLLSTASNAVEDNYTDYLSDLIDSKESSFLDELDDFNVEVIFKEMLKNSIAYMLLVRCGFSADEYLDLDDFQNIINFNTIETISRLGATTSDISEMILREIGVTVKSIQKSEKNKDRTIEKNRSMLDNEGVNNKAGRLDDHGVDVHDAGGLPNTGSGSAGGENAHWQIWDVAKDIPKEPQERDVYQPDDIRKTEQSSNRNRSSSERADRENHGETSRVKPGTGQREGPDGMDGAHEQPSTLNGRDDTRRTNLQLNIFPTIEQQIEVIEQAEDKKTFAFSIVQEEIDYLLCKGIGFQDGKYRVYLHYQEQHSTKDTIDFLKDEYGIGGGTHIFINGSGGIHWHDGKGITLSKNDVRIPNLEVNLTWPQVAKRLGELIKADRYLNNKEKEYLPTIQQEMEERHRKLAEEAYVKQTIKSDSIPTEDESLVSRDTGKYVFHLGDTVYIGADEYEILSFSDQVVELRDIKYPLLTKELPREVFEEMLRENPLNDHFLTVEESPEQLIIQKTDKLSPKDLYRKYLPEIVNRIRLSVIYPYLRDRDTEPESAKQELDDEIDNIAISMREMDSGFFEAYTNLPQFKEWLSEDVFQRTYQDYLTEKRDSVTIHADDPKAPEWVRQTRELIMDEQGNIVITRLEKGK